MQEKCNNQPRENVPGKAGNKNDKCSTGSITINT